MYKVVNNFRDAKNNDHLYMVGDEYPVAGSKPSKTRIEELAKGKNKYGRVFIEEVKEAPVNPADGDTPDSNGGEEKPETQTAEGDTKE